MNRWRQSNICFVSACSQGDPSTIQTITPSPPKQTSKQTNKQTNKQQQHTNKNNSKQKCRMFPVPRWQEDYVLRIILRSRMRSHACAGIRFRLVPVRSHAFSGVLWALGAISYGACENRHGRGSKLIHRGPQVLVPGSIYQGSFLGTYF